VDGETKEVWGDLNKTQPDPEAAKRKRENGIKKQETSHLPLFYFQLFLLLFLSFVTWCFLSFIQNIFLIDIIHLLSSLHLSGLLCLSLSLSLSLSDFITKNSSSEFYFETTPRLHRCSVENEGAATPEAVNWPQLWIIVINTHCVKYWTLIIRRCPWFWRNSCCRYKSFSSLVKLRLSCISHRLTPSPVTMLLLWAAHHDALWQL